MKQHYLIVGFVASVLGSQAYASITPQDMAAQKQSTGTAPSYVQNVDTSKRTVTVDQTTYTVSPSVVVHEGKKTTTMTSIKKGTRIKVASEKKVGQANNVITEIWVMQQPSGK
ncbi:hypothetical protein ACO0LM_10705 [Undibacterium sp. Di26W]|uniref:hypothetical protein n=1 Tax=Undibacterium sp. Di26W TaxID=3413035 RepID=UPI003BF35916